ncbi:MAG: RHS repeat-associated core domain-containing protein, partial [Nitrospirota bacterium]|nr:RHS repeat-associated core domain-containing protein [Nitrospirota bacterium]
LGSVALELDETAQIVGCEEFHPYGTTAYHLVGSVRATAKRYRYTGMERDEETRLSYHNARYLIPWLGRWGSTDPIGLEGGGNIYSYSQGDPIGLLDNAGTQSTDCEFDMCFSLEEAPEPARESGYVSIENGLLVQPTIEDGEITGLTFSEVVSVELPTLERFLYANDENDQTRAVLTDYWRQHHPRGVSLYSESVVGPFRHAFLRVTTDEGDFVVEVGDAEGIGERTADPRLAYWEAHTETYTLHEDAITRPADPSEDAQFEERLLEISAYFSRQDERGDYINLPTYGLLGPNSNGYVRYVIESAGGQVVMDSFLFPAHDVTEPYSETPSEREERLRQLRERASEIGESMSIFGFPL